MGKHSITRHHRLPSSHGGDDSANNISMVQEQHHRAWHLLFKDDTPEVIVKKLNCIWLPMNAQVQLTQKE